jgi:hypothetical protein
MCFTSREEEMEPNCSLTDKYTERQRKRLRKTRLCEEKTRTQERKEGQWRHRDEGVGRQ